MKNILYGEYEYFEHSDLMQAIFSTKKSKETINDDQL